MLIGKPLQKSILLRCSEYTVYRWDSWKKSLLCESPKKERVWQFLLICTALNKKRHFTYFIELNRCSNCHFWVWLCIWTATINEHPLNMHGFVWKGWTAADPLASKHQRFTRSSLQEDGRVFHKLKSCPTTAAELKQRPGLMVLCFSRCFCAPLVCVCFRRGLTCVRSVRGRSAEL